MPWKRVQHKTWSFGLSAVSLVATIVLTSISIAKLPAAVGLRNAWRLDANHKRHNIAPHDGVARLFDAAEGEEPASSREESRGAGGRSDDSSSSSSTHIICNTCSGFTALRQAQNCPDAIQYSSVADEHHAMTYGSRPQTRLSARQPAWKQPTGFSLAQVESRTSLVRRSSSVSGCCGSSDAAAASPPSSTSPSPPVPLRGGPQQLRQPLRRHHRFRHHGIPARLVHALQVQQVLLPHLPARRSWTTRTTGRPSSSACLRCSG